MAFSLCACKGNEPEPTAQPTAQPTPEESYAPVSFRNHGNQSTVTALPQKVVTAGPNCTEVFCALGLADKVIDKCMENHSLGALPEYADAVESIPTLSIGYPTAQQIIDSGCDLLYASSWIFDDDLTVAQLEKAGITVYVSEAETIEAVWQEMRDLAKIFSVENIEEIVSEQSTRLEAVADKLGDVTEPKTVFVLDSFIGEKLYTAGSSIEGVMGGNLPWNLVFIGVFIAIVVELLGISVMSFAIGIYLPIETTACIMIGGILRAIVDKKKYKNQEEKDTVVNKGILACSGMIAGEGLVGILLAIFANVPVGAGTLADAVDLSKFVDFGTVGTIVVFAVMIVVVLKATIWSKKNEK